MPAILPTPANSNVAHLGVQSGKDAMLRLINLDNLSGMSGPGHLGGELQKISVPQGGGVLTQPAVWVFTLAGACGVPADALALAANVTVISPPAGGTLRVTPTGFASPSTTISFNPGQIRSNTRGLSLTGHPVGDATVEADLPGSVNVVIDVFGYFK